MRSKTHIKKTGEETLCDIDGEPILSYVDDPDDSDRGTRFVINGKHDSIASGLPLDDDEALDLFKFIGDKLGYEVED